MEKPTCITNRIRIPLSTNVTFDDFKAPNNGTENLNKDIQPINSANPSCTTDIKQMRVICIWEQFFRRLCEQIKTLWTGIEKQRHNLNMSHHVSNNLDVACRGNAQIQSMSSIMDVGRVWIFPLYSRGSSSTGWCKMQVKFLQVTAAGNREGQGLIGCIKEFCCV